MLETKAKAKPGLKSPEDRIKNICVWGMERNRLQGGEEALKNAFNCY